MQTVPGARALFAVRAAALGWYVLSTLLWSLPLHDHFDLWFRGVTVVWLMVSAAELAATVPFSQGRQGTSAEMPARALLILFAVGFLLFVVGSLPELGARQMALSSSLSHSLSLAETLVFLAAEVFLWIALLRSLAEPPGWNLAFYTLLLLSAAFSLLHLVLPPDQYLKLHHDLATAALLRWGRVAVGVGLRILPLLLLSRLVTEGGAATGQPVVVKRSPGRDIAIGAIWLGGGLLVTLVSYSAAASSATGGRYVVATGAIVYGLARLVRGFVKL